MFRALCIASILLLAGCTDNNATPADEDVEHGGTQHVMQDVEFFAESFDFGSLFAGDFQAHEAANIQSAAGIAGQPVASTQVHDISSMLPQGIPIFVELSVESGDVDVWLSTDDFAAMWTSACTDCNSFGAGKGWSGAILNTGQSFGISVFYPGGQVPEDMGYTVWVQVTTAPDRIPSGMVIAVDMPSIGSHILFEGDVADVMVFDPDDVFIRTLPANDPQMYIEEGMATGEYVFLPTGHGSFYKLRSGSDVADGDVLDVEARILTQRVESSGPHAVAQNTEILFELDRQPLQVGASYFGRASADARVTLMSADGVGVSIGHTGLAGPGVGAFDQTAMGDPALGPGTYTLTWTDTVNDGTMQIQEFFVFYQR